MALQSSSYAARTLRKPTHRQVKMVVPLPFPLPVPGVSPFLGPRPGRDRGLLAVFVATVVTLIAAVRAVAMVVSVAAVRGHSWPRPYT